MKKIGVFLCIILCGVILVFSYASYKDKLASAGKQEVRSTISTGTSAKDTKATSESTVGETAPIDLETLTASMDPQVQKLFFDRKEQGDKVDFLILGSEVMDSGDPGYATLLADALHASYGDFVETKIMSYDGTSEEFLMSRPQLSDGYDLVLMEPFTLKNNGIVEIETEHVHIQNVIGEILTAVNDAILVLHPPQPIYGAQFYRTQVSALEEFAEHRNYAYINHWEEWPSTDDVYLKDFLTEESNPNNIGAETWANTLIAYFTGS